MLDQICKQIAAIAATVPGVKRSYELAPEGLNDLPCAVTTPFTGDIDWPRKPALRTSDHTVKLVIFVSRADLPTAEAQARPFISAVVEEFDQHLTLNGAAANSGVTHYSYGKLTYGAAEAPYLGVEFLIRATEREVANYAP